MLPGKFPRISMRKPFDGDASPYAALAIAVRNEERAFAFYCHAAAAAR